MKKQTRRRTRRSPYNVRWLQQSLNTLIDAGLVVDGVYGPLTNAAVVQFQKQRGIPLDAAIKATIEAALAARSV